MGVYLGRVYNSSKMYMMHTECMAILNYGDRHHAPQETKTSWRREAGAELRGKDEDRREPGGGNVLDDGLLHAEWDHQPVQCGTRSAICHWIEEKVPVPLDMESAGWKSCLLLGM